MKTTRLGLWSVVPLLALGIAGYAQETEASPTEVKTGLRRPPQGLRRLAGGTAEAGGSVIPADAITIVDIASPQATGTGGRIASQGNIRYLALPPGAEWSVPLRPRRAGANYTTFTMLASVDTVVSVDGALVSLVPSGHEGYATVMIGRHKDNVVQLASLNHDVPVQPYSGQPMGSLSVVTICTDTETGEWSVILLDQLATYGIPLGPLDPDARRVLAVKAGPAGAWVCAVANSDENPVFDDVNHNGIRDSFETKLLGAPLPRNASRKARDDLMRVWEQKFDLQSGDYSVEKPKGTDGPEWKNAPSTYFLEIPYPDPTPQPAVQGVRGIPGAVLINPNATQP